MKEERPDTGLAGYYDETLKCIRCGLCQAVCPVFAVERREPALARGKVQLVRALLEGRLSTSSPLREWLFQCLLCGACAENCPSGVDVTGVLRAARRQLVADLGLPATERLLLRSFLADSGRLDFGGRALTLYQRTGVRWLAQRLHLLDALPGHLGQKEHLLPRLASPPARDLLPADALPGTVRTQVVYFLGCVTNVAYPGLARALVAVLRKNRCRVLIPADLHCCGMPHHTYGDVAVADELAAHNVEILNVSGAEAIVTDCATCSHTLKGYSGLRAPVYDVSEYLMKELGLVEPEGKVRLAVTYHDPCHLGRAQGVRAAPRDLLRAVPGVDLVEMAEADRCCGGGGAFALSHYDLSQRILARKIDNARATAAQAIATSCPSCRMQLEHGLRESPRDASRTGPTEVWHPVEILHRAYLWGAELSD